MAEFARFYLEYLKTIWDNFISFWSGFFSPFIKIFTEDIPNLINDFALASVHFDFWGWLMFIVVFIASAVLVFFVLYRVGLVIRRYIIFRAKEVDKDQIIEELAIERDKNARLAMEKNQIYALKINAMYPGKEYALENKQEDITEEVTVQEDIAPASRFSKLISLDQEYALAPTFISTAEVDKMSLFDIVERFINYSASNHKLYYDRSTIRRFIAGMATSKVLILEGISGTGKTSLPYAFSKFLGNDPAIVSVQPSWRDRADIMGYLNEFTKTYNESSFLSAVYESTYREDPSLIILDEMNLARIEYYFAEFLSIMEMPNKNEWKIEVVSNEKEGDPAHINDGQILVPQSLWFIGTANQDDSTFTITDKVYDRAITLDLNNRADYFDAPFTDGIKLSNSYLELLFADAEKTQAMSQEFLDKLKQIDEFVMEKFKITFGNRILRQIKKFVPAYVACGGTETDAIDFLLMSKIFRKFTALNLIFLKKELKALITLLDKTFGVGKCKISIEYINTLMERA